MLIKKLLALLVMVFLIASCAGIPYQNEAHYAYEEGLALFNQGKYTEAIPHFQRAIELDPEYSSPYLYLGRSYLILSRWTDAIQPLRTAFRLSPTEFKGEAVSLLLDALIGGALAEFKAGNFEGSIGYLREALSLNPESQKAQDELSASLIAFGGQLFSEGRFSDAIPAFSEAIELSPDNLDAYIGLAKAFLKNGNYMKALETVKGAANINPESSDAQNLLRGLLNQ
jgi:tetratricopeptide (TPR) repeat protein